MDDNKIITVEGDSWIIEIHPTKVFLFTENTYFSGSFQEVEDCMAETRLMRRKDFQREIWENAFLGAL